MDASENIDRVKELIQQEVSKGNIMITFPDDPGMLTIDSLNFFNNAYDAIEFCYENSTDFDHFRIGNQQTVLDLFATQEKENKLVNHKNEIMNQENFDYLKNQVKFTGFGESLENDLKASIAKQEPNFQLKHKHEFGKDQTTTLLNFRKADQSDMYFFNSYSMLLKQGGSDDLISQKFYVGKENTFTMKEAYNLMSGRAVNKDLVNKEKEGYNAWVQLDFKDTDANGNYKLKHFTENYGFDMEQVLAKHPIKELNNADDKAKLIESLQKGNRQSVTFLSDGNEQKRFIEASPQYKSINVYDGDMKRIRLDQKEGEASGQSAKQDQKKEQKQADDESGGNQKVAQKKNKKHGQGIS